METVRSQPLQPRPLDSAVVHAELRRVLSSDQFRTAPRLSRFLEYVLERTIAGESDELKEYRIGVDVFERSASYDPRTDPVVRVEAGRLRTKLASFYHGDGRHSQIRIEVPKGGYAAVFKAFVHTPTTEAGGENAISSARSNAPAEGSRRLSRGVLIAAALGALVLALAAYAIYRLALDKRLPFETIITEKITHSGDVRLAAISPDGGFILTVSTEEGMESLRLRNVATGSNMQLVPPAQVHYRGIRFSRDGNSLYFVRSEEENLSLAYLYRVPILGGQPQRLIADIDSNISFSPDGKQFVFATYGTDQYRVVLASQDGKSLRDLIRGPMTAPLYDPVWSPDGNVVVATTQDSGNAFSTLVAIDIASGERRVLFKSDTAKVSLLRPLWLPDGSGLLVLVSDQSSNFTQQNISLVTYPQGKMQPVTRETNNYVDFSVAADGRTLAAVVLEARWDLFVVHPDSPDGADSRQLTSDAPIQSFSWTPDDKLVIWQNSGLFLLDPDTGSRSRLNVPTTGLASQPSVCPDGRVVFVLSKIGGDEGQSIWRINSDGQDLTRLTQGRYDQFPMCTSDSRSVYYEDFTQSQNFWKVSLSGGDAKPVGEYTMSRCPWCDRLFDLSSDGEWAALPTFVGSDPHLKLLLLRLTSSSPAEVIEFRQSSLLPPIRFAGSAHWLAYPVRTRGVDNVWVQQINGPGFRQLTHFTSGRIRDFKFSPDGARLAYTRAHEASDVVLIRDSSR